MTEQYRSFINIFTEYTTFKKIFKQFANPLKSHFESDTCQIQGICVELDFDKNYFEVFFAGYKLMFNFSVQLVTQDGSSLCAEIKCLTTDPMTDTKVQINKFTFSKAGTTNFYYEPLEKKLSINDPEEARYIVFHYLREYLSYEKK